MIYIEEIDLTSHGILPTMAFQVVITTDDNVDGRKIFYFKELEG